MKIVSYLATGDAPKGHRALARILLNDGTFHPGFATRETVEAATAAMQAFWDAEFAKELARQQPRRRKTAAPTPTPAEPDVGDVI